ncbi:hypothetical protein HNY73_017466 [Argiope bruennichi]|uniref:Uncharacterized protein n=1 Tax=Argiope bruennichi TaxID=94029 RepID=A0A8T0EAS6_ARGBR|nr:hypothetical protein HNY73_017466 [Argiope bruennichi]
MYRTVNQKGAAVSSPRSFDLGKNKNNEWQESSLNERNDELHTKEMGNFNEPSDDSPVSSDRQNLSTSKSAEIHSEWQDELNPPLCFPTEESSSNPVSEESDTESLAEMRQRTTVLCYSLPKLIYFLSRTMQLTFQKMIQTRKKCPFCQEMIQLLITKMQLPLLLPLLDASSENTSCSVDRVGHSVNHEKLKH